MPHRPASRALIAGALFLSLSAGSGPASADVFLETTYLPTSSVVTLPSSSLLPTSYIVPTSYTSSYIPTSAIYATGDVLYPAATSYVVPTYRTVRYRPRRYVERTAYYAAPVYSPIATTSYLAPTSTLLPTSYVVPSTYLTTSYVAPSSSLIDTGLVMTSASGSMCCDSGSTSAPAPSRTTTRPAPAGGNGSGGTITSTPSSGQSGERMPSGAADPAGSMDDGKSSRVTPGVSASAAQVTPPPPTPAGSDAPVGTRAGDELDPNAIQIDKPGKTGAEAPPGLPKFDQATRRDSQRPASYAPAEPRNILRGKVVAFGSRRPEESVTVILSSKTGAFGDRTAMTDADGEFKISLPPGDWVVKVKMPSGSILPIGLDQYLTASSGRITDPSGRPISQFTITR